MSIRWTDSARKKLAAIARGDAKVARQIRATIHTFQDDGHGDVKMLKGEDGELRLRVRNYRVRLHREGDDLVVTDVGKRGEFYR